MAIVTVKTIETIKIILPHQVNTFDDDAVLLSYHCLYYPRLAFVDAVYNVHIVAPQNLFYTM